MTKDELLKYAKENYPVGTKYKCPANIGDHRLGTGINIVELGDEIKFRKDDEIDIIYKGYIYYKGKWAEILEKPKVETKFEVGKWYKGLGGSKNYYGICAGKISEGEFPCKIYIKPDGGYVTNGTHFYDFNGAELLTDLSEIQQYLPEGHPDKFATPIAKEEFVLPEKWCVKVTNKELVPDKYKSPFYKEYYAYSNKINGFEHNYYTGGNKAPDYTEITFDQFKKYVLKQEVKEEVETIERWSVGSYVVALKNCCIGITNFNTGDIAVVLSNGKISLLSDNSIWDCYKNRDTKYNDVKWLPTLQEAQKFSNELLGKSKTSLRVEDLVKGEIYRHDEGNLMEKNEEYPEYVECIYSTGSRFTVNKIYKVKSRKESCLVILSNNGKNENTGGYPLNGVLWKFKPSTKEAYEAQFKKDDKFKNGDWLVYIGDCGYKPTTPIKIGDVRQMIEGRFGSLVIYGGEDLSQYFRRALPHEIPINNSIKEEPKLVFPYKVGDRIRCIKLNTWSSSAYSRSPLNTCNGKVVEITKIRELDNIYRHIPFAATYNGVEYGFSYSDDNKYELVESLEDAVRTRCIEMIHQMDFSLVKPEECYLKKQEFKNPLDDSEKEVNINFSKPKQIKFL